MQQLTLFDPPSPPMRVPVWDALGEEARQQLIARLARLIAQVIVTPGDRSHERTEQDHH